MADNSRKTMLSVEIPEFNRRIFWTTYHQQKNTWKQTIYLHHYQSLSVSELVS